VRFGSGSLDRQANNLGLVSQQVVHDHDVTESVGMGTCSIARKAMPFIALPSGA